MRLDADNTKSHKLAKCIDKNNLGIVTTYNIKKTSDVIA